jgi:hypothetical protein
MIKLHIYDYSECNDHVVLMSARNGDINITYITQIFIYFKIIVSLWLLISKHESAYFTVLSGFYRNSAVLAITMLNTNILHIDSLSQIVFKAIK